MAEDRGCGPESMMDVPSLEDCCISYIFFNLEVFPVHYLGLLPIRMRRKILFQLPVTDICKLEETAVVEGVDMNLVWKNKCSKLLITGMGLGREDTVARSLDFIYSDLVAPSTRRELGQDHGYKQSCSEYVFGTILKGKISEAKEMLCHGYSCSVCECPPRHSSCDNQETLLAMAVQCFGPPIRLFMCGQAPQLLSDPTFVSSIVELEWTPNFDTSILQYTSPDIKFLSTSWTSLESLYLNECYKLGTNDFHVLKPLLPQLKILHIDSRFWYSGFEAIIDMFLITPSPKKQELRFFYLIEGWSDNAACTWRFSTTNKVVVIGENWEVPEWTRTLSYSLRSHSYEDKMVAEEDVQDDILQSLMKKYPFILDTRKRKFEEIEQ